MKKLTDHNPASGKIKDLEQKILVRTSEFKVPEGTSSAEALAKLKTRIAENEAESAKIRSLERGKGRLLLSMAAGLLVLFGIWQIWFTERNTSVIAQKGSRIDYRLPDGSEVKLNADSRISLNKKAFPANRNLSLEGEAFFKVTRGSAFNVSTVSGTVKVLGTSFNVYSRAGAFRVSCLTGKVMVTSGNSSLTINPGESAELRGKELFSFADQSISKVTGWIDGEFYFNNSPVNLVFDEIERQFNVKFAGRNIKPGFFTGSFTNKDLHEALDIVCIPLGLNYEIGKEGDVFVSDKSK
jgi:transmembrane sensor